jgi:hypothetical protein
VNQAKSNDADAFDDLLGQLVDELAMTRRATPEPEPDQAALLGIARPEPQPIFDAPIDSRESVDSGPAYAPEIAVPRSSTGKYLAIGGGLAIALTIVGIYAVDKMSAPPPTPAASRLAPDVAAGLSPTATVPAQNTIATVPDPNVAAIPAVDPTNSATANAAAPNGAENAAAADTEAKPEVAKPKSSGKRRKTSRKPKTAAKKKSKDSFDDL